MLVSDWSSLQPTDMQKHLLLFYQVIYLEIEVLQVLDSSSNIINNIIAQPSRYSINRRY